MRKPRAVRRGLDAANQSRPRRSSKAKGDLSKPRATHDPEPRSVLCATPLKRDAAKLALADICASSGEVPVQELGLADALERERGRSAARRAQQHGREANGALVLLDMQGRQVDLSAERGHEGLAEVLPCW